MSLVRDVVPSCRMFQPVELLYDSVRSYQMASSGSCRLLRYFLVAIFDGTVSFPYQSNFLVILNLNAFISGFRSFIYLNIIDIKG
jgi:hypothetical protein